MNPTQAEAGPSTPRTPPSTPPASAKSASRRRSWFGFVGSPFLGSPTTSASGSPRRKSFATEDRDDVELADRSNGHITPIAVAGRRKSVQLGDENKGDRGQEEVLTIDGQVETPASIRKRKKRQSRAGQGEEQEMGDVVRLDDLTVGRKSSLRTALWPVKCNDIDQMDESQRRTSTDDGRPPDLQPTITPSPPPKSPKPDLTVPQITKTISPRKSSLSIPSIRVPPDKGTPPLPTDRPLPALPRNGRSSPPPPLSLIPTGIVITPSSPRKLQKPYSATHARRTSASMTDLRAGRHPSTNGRPRTTGSATSSRSSSQNVSRENSFIGLGRPKGASPNEGEGMLPPPVPHKTQSVSSPIPSRSASPVPKISFAEPENEEKERGRPEKKEEQVKKDKEKVKRARSLSGIFTRSASQPVPSKAGSAVNGCEVEGKGEEVEMLAEPSQDVGTGESGKMAGVLEWLGVKKAGKRRFSDAKLVGMEREKESRRGSEEYRGSEELESDGKVKVDEGVRPRMRDVSSSTTIMPGTEPAMSSTPAPVTEEVQQSLSGPAGAPHRIDSPDPTLPSRSHIDISPSHLSSPISENDEFFSPPTAPWVDGTEASQRTSSASSTATDPPPSKEVPTSQPVTVPKDGRLRSWSDAPTPSPHLIPPEPRGSPIMQNDSDYDASQVSLTSTVRPKIGNRSHSGNSAIIEKMKGVFSLSSARNRARSKSLLPQEIGDTEERVMVDEFGGKLTDSVRAGTASTASLASSYQWSPGPATNSSLLDLHLGRQVITDSPSASPRTSFSQSTPPSAYTHSIPSSIISETTSSATPIIAKGNRARGRASTVSFASSAPLSSFLPPPPPLSPNLFPSPGGLTPPRRRPSAIQRFSSGLLGSSAPSSPKGSLFPLPPRSSGSTFSSAGAGGAGYDDAQSNATGATSLLMSPGASPRPSSGSGTGTGSVGWKVDIKVEEGETAAGWLERMVGCVGRDEIAGVLASSGDELHTRALQLYMSQFDFTHHALDVALRQLLMQISLPKETQQIDRVLEAFAKRYEVCEPGLFGSKDNTYVLAFSMMMLHTDVFNKNNKNKMSKADYVRNTRMEGVSPLTLEAFYDNITYTPFVYVNVDSDVTPSSFSVSGGRSRSGSDALTPTPAVSTGATTSSGSSFSSSTPWTPGTASSPSTFTPSSLTPRRGRPPTPTTASSLSTKQPDIYALITQNNLHPLRVDLERSIPAESPFSCVGTKPYLDMGLMQNAFVGAGILKIGGSANEAGGKRKASGAVRGKKGAESDNEGTTSTGDGEVALRVTKVGTLSRKDDATDSSNRKTSRKWKSWSVILTGSQLLFFKDPFWALTLQEQMKSDSVNAKRDEKGQVLLPRVARFVPDEVFPVKDAVAVWDRSLTGQPHTFRFHLPHRTYLIQASDDDEMNEWIGLINYAAAFKTAGIRMRAGTMKRDQALLAGAAAASSLRRESKSLDAVGEDGIKGKKVFGYSAADDPMPPTAPIDIARTPGGRRISNGTTNGDNWTPTSILAVRTSNDSQRSRSKASKRSSSESPVSSRNACTSVDRESVGIVTKDEGERLGEVFRAVKAELAAETGLGLAPLGNETVTGKARAGLRVRIPSSQAVRSTAVDTAIRDLVSKLSSAQSNLDIHLTQARNLAILTPFQRTTRDRISSAIPPLATQIRDERLRIAKYSLWISILQCDLDREEKEWEGVSGLALQGAERSLKTEKGVRGVMGDVQSGEGSRVRFKAAEDVLNGEEKSIGDEGTEEVLSDMTNGRQEYQENSDNGSASLGTTPQELPVLIRLGSDDAAQHLARTEVRVVSPNQQRPGMRRHASASAM